MSPVTPESVARILDENEFFEPAGDGYQITSSTFDSILRTEEITEESQRYTLTVHVPSLDSATGDDVGTAVSTDWLRTLQVRLRDAPKSTRREVHMVSNTVHWEEDQVRIEYAFQCESPETAADIAKAFAEFVEGTYVETVIPGYEYEPPVSTLLSRASQGEKGGTPL